MCHIGCHSVCLKCIINKPHHLGPTCFNSLNYLSDMPPNILSSTEIFIIIYIFSGYFLCTYFSLGLQLLTSINVKEYSFKLLLKSFT